MGAAAVFETAAETPPTIVVVSIRFLGGEVGAGCPAVETLGLRLLHDQALRQDILRKSAMKGCKDEAYILVDCLQYVLWLIDCEGKVRQM